MWLIAKQMMEMILVMNSEMDKIIVDWKGSYNLNLEWDWKVWKADGRGEGILGEGSNRSETQNKNP